MQPATIVLSAAKGWSEVQIAAHLSEPVFQPAITFNQGQPIVGWWAHPVNGGPIQLTFSNLKTMATVHSLALGQIPDHLSLFPSAYGLLAIWRDQNMDSADPTDRRLYAALFNSDLTLARSPTQITDEPTDAYAAELLASGDIAIAWTGHSGDAADSLSLSALGVGGTVFPATRVATNAAHPALTTTATGQLIVGWVSPQPGSIWAIQVTPIQTMIDLTHKITFQSGMAVTIGFLQPGGINNSQVLDSFTLGSDNTDCYAVWSIAGIRPDTTSALTALIFSCASTSVDSGITSMDAAQITIADGGRWPTSLLSVQGSTVGVPIGATIEDHYESSPAVIWLHGGQVTRIDKLALLDPQTTIGSVGLATDPANGRLIATWSEINPDGTITLNMAQQSS